jgi:hypothetical protein
MPRTTIAEACRQRKIDRKDWDEDREVWRDHPRHDVNSHGADGFMTFACGYTTPYITDDFDEPDDERGSNETTGY